MPEVTLSEFVDSNAFKQADEEKRQRGLRNWFKIALDENPQLSGSQLIQDAIDRDLPVPTFDPTEALSAIREGLETGTLQGTGTTLEEQRAERESRKPLEIPEPAVPPPVPAVAPEPGRIKRVDRPPTLPPPTVIERIAAAEQKVEDTARSVRESVENAAQAFQRGLRSTNVIKRTNDELKLEILGAKTLTPGEISDIRRQRAEANPRGQKFLVQGFQDLGANLPRMVDAIASGTAAAVTTEAVVLFGGLPGLLPGFGLGPATKVAGGLGAAASMFNDEKLDTYLELRSIGIDKKIANTVSNYAGSMKAATEVLELTVIAGALPRAGFANLLNHPAIKRRWLTAVAKNPIFRAAPVAVGELGEEVAQNLTDIIAKEMAKAIQVEGSKIKAVRDLFGSKEALIQRMNEAGEVIKEAGPLAFLLSLVPLSVGGVQAAAAKIKKSAPVSAKIAEESKTTQIGPPTAEEIAAQARELPPEARELIEEEQRAEAAIQEEVERQEQVREVLSATPEEKAEETSPVFVVEGESVVEPTEVEIEERAIERESKGVEPEITEPPLTPIEQPIKQAVVAQQESKAEPELEIQGPFLPFTRERLEAARRTIGLADVPVVERQRTAELVDTALREGLVDKAEELAGQINADPIRIPNALQQVALAIRLEELEPRQRQISRRMSELVEAGKITEARALNNEQDDIIVKIDRLTRALIGTGTELSRAFSVRQRLRKNIQLDADNLIQEATLAKGIKLTEKERGNLENIKKQLLDTQIKVDEETTKFDTDKQLSDERKADKNLKDELNTIKQKRTHEELVALREKIKARIRKKGYRTNVGVPVDLAIDIGALARTYIENGILGLRDLVNNIIADVPGLEQRDVMEVLANRSTGQLRKAESDTKKILRNLKTQARLVLDIEDALKGIFTERKPKAKVAKEIQQLRKKLKAIRWASMQTVRDEARLKNISTKIDRIDEQIQGEFRDIKKKREPDPERINVAKKALREARTFMNIQDRILDVEEQLRTKIFDVSPKRKAAISSERLERAQIKLLRLRKKARAEINKLRPRTPGGKLFDAVAGVAFAQRGLKATGEISAVGRQGLGLIAHQLFSGPKGIKTIADSFGRSIKTIFDSHTADAIMLHTMNDPFQLERDRATLELTDLDSVLTSNEEEFLNNFVEEFPILGPVIKASARQAVTFLNLMRIASFDNVVKANPGMTQEQKIAWAKTVNALSGRSSLKKFLTDTSLKFTAILGFAPNFAASRIEAPLRTLNNLRDPILRKESIKTMAGFVTLQSIFYALSHLAGGEIGTDPEEFDFGRVTFGNTKIDLLAGVNQPFRVILTAGLWAANQFHLHKTLKKQSTLDALARFFYYKQSPLVGTARGIVFGKDIHGRDVPRVEAALRAPVMIYAEEIAEAAQMNRKAFRKKATSLTAGLGFLGASVTTIPNELFRPRIRRLYKDKGIPSITQPKWPEWTKERRFIKERRNLEAVFNEVMARWLLENERKIKRMREDEGREFILDKATEIRGDMLDQLPDTPPRI